jgi:hypothetical protein
MSSYWQGKGAGKRIAIRFDKPLLGDVSGNEGAFTVTGMVRNPLKTGELQPKEFTVDSVERYPLQILWQDDFSGQMDGVEVGENGIRLNIDNQVPAFADTYTNESSPDKNFGANEEMFVLGYAGYYCRAFMKFDIPAIDITNIQKVELFVYYFANDMPSREQRHHIKRITEAWDENLLTYNNTPAFNGQGSLTTGSYGTLENIDGHNTGINNWRKVDITTLVLEWLNGTHPNHGLVIDHTYNQSYDGGVWAMMRYRTREYNGGSLAPYLKITYSPGTKFIGTYASSIGASTLNNPRLRYDADTPEGTSITAEYACTDGSEPDSEDWAEIEDGDLLTITGTTLWLRYTLTTDDPAVTPTLLSAWLEEATAPPGTILLTMAPDSRFNDVEGDITVSYEQAKGTLTGTRPVGDFTESFTPTDLEPTPIDRHDITAGIEVAVDLIKVDYIDLGHKNTITAGITVEVDLIPVSVIPP